jgi:hypothetical protein
MHEGLQPFIEIDSFNVYNLIDDLVTIYYKNCI